MSRKSKVDIDKTVVISYFYTMCSLEKCRTYQMNRMQLIHFTKEQKINYIPSLYYKANENRPGCVKGT